MTHSYTDDKDMKLYGGTCTDRARYCQISRSDWGFHETRHKQRSFRIVIKLNNDK